MGKVAQGPYQWLRATIANAVAAEREACAKLVEDCGAFVGSHPVAEVEEADRRRFRRIAERIRERGEAPVAELDPRGIDEPYPWESPR